MATRVSYPVEVKKKAIEMRLDGIPVKEVMEQLNSLVVTDAQITLRIILNFLLRLIPSDGARCITHIEDVLFIYGKITISRFIR
ncbi:hypothetical protein P4H46_23700 [Paenibacillus glucanolyticus]